MTSKHVEFYQETWEVNPKTLSFELETNWELPCFKNTKWSSFKKQLVIVIPAKPGELLTVGQHWNGDLAKIYSNPKRASAFSGTKKQVNVVILCRYFEWFQVLVDAP